MLKNGKLLFDYKERIKRKYGYDDEFASTISMMAESISEYLGSEYEEAVMDALASCKFVVTKNFKKGDKTTDNTLDVLKREGVYDRIVGAKEEEIRVDKSMYASKPHISYNGTSYKIDGVDRVVVLGMNFNNDSIGSLGELAHEALKVVNSHLNEYRIEGDILTHKFGLCTETNRLSQEGGNIKRTFVSRTGIGLEKGIVSYDELCLMREFFDSNYEVSGADYQRVIAGQLMDGMNLREMIRKALITKDDTELRALFDTHLAQGYDEFLRSIDDIAHLENKRYASLSDPTSISSANASLEQHFKATVVPQMIEMKSSLNPEMSLEESYKVS